MVHQLRTFSAVNHYKLAGSPTLGDEFGSQVTGGSIYCVKPATPIWVGPISLHRAHKSIFFGVRTMAVELGYFRSCKCISTFFVVGCTPGETKEHCERCALIPAFNRPVP